MLLEIIEEAGLDRLLSCGCDSVTKGCDCKGGDCVCQNNPDGHCFTHNVCPIKFW